MTEHVRAHLTIEGRVQGVFFRARTREHALEAGVTGWVRNRDDGHVEAVLEGPRAAVERVIAWCHTGPPMARVARVAVQWEPPTAEQGFAIR